MEIFEQEQACSMDKYMEFCLFDEKRGFYQTQCIDTNFVTPLTLNSGFKKLLARYLSSQSSSLLEIGPGHGQLAQCLQELRQKNETSVTDHYLLEKSKKNFLQLKKKFSQDPSIHLQQKLDKSFQGTVFVQEVLDCFPAQWISYENGELREKFLTSDFKILKKKLNQNSALIENYLKFLLEQGVYEKDSFDFMYSQSKLEFLEELFLLKNSTFLFVDYGFLSRDLIAANKMVSCPIRAYQAHQQIKDFWPKVGLCDLTYDIDFSWLLSQGIEKGATVNFYGSLAEFIVQYGQLCEEEISLLKPYLDPRQLGEVFKVALLKTEEKRKELE